MKRFEKLEEKAAITKSNAESALRIMRRSAQFLKVNRLRTRAADDALVPRVERPPVQYPDNFAPTPSAGSGRNLLNSFLLFVILPVAGLFVYLFFVASEEYVAEARLTVRQPQVQKQLMADALSIFSKIGLGGAAQGSLQDAFVVSNYIKGRSIIDDLGGKALLLPIFGKSEVDYLSRLSPSSSNEEIWKYWTDKVIASVDTPSSIITVKVRAFAPQDAKLLAEKIIAASEVLVNRMSERSRTDALRQARDEVDKAISELSKARQDMVLLRNRRGTFDPVAVASSIGEQISKLTMERIGIENNIASLPRSLDTSSPNAQLLRQRLEAVNKQIDAAQRKLTDASNPNSLAAQLSEFELLTLKEKFAEKMNEIAQAGYEKARQELVRQQLYLVQVVAPTVPEIPLYPKILLSCLFAFLACLATWATLSLIVASIKDHMAH